MSLELKSTLSEAPNFVPHRVVSDANETTFDTERKHGMNGDLYNEAIVQVIPDAGVTPTVDVLFWSEAAAKFIPDQTPITKAGSVGGQAFSFSFPILGRVFLVRVTAGLSLGKSVRIDCAGHREQ